MEEYSEAIEYDLLTKTGYSLDDVGGALSWSSLDTFLHQIGLDSALMREINPEWAAWAGNIKTNFILADIYDMLAHINANLVAMGTRKPAKRIKPYPRPKTKKNPENERHFGRDALPVSQLHEWMEKKRAEYARSSTGHDSGDPGTARGTAKTN